jgi:hypothetical protein
MRINRDTLVKFAKENAKKISSADRNIIASFLVGSLLKENPFIGGVTDIDLLFVCRTEPKTKREVIRLSNDIHLDIMYAAREEFEPPRKLRTDPWRGYLLYDPMLLDESEHFLEYAQAIVRSQFEAPSNLIARVQHHLTAARSLWSELSLEGVENAKNAHLYLRAVYHASNAIAAFTGAPLTERRLLLDLPQRASAVGKPEWNDAVLTLIGVPSFDSTLTPSWLADWETVFHAAAEMKSEPRIHVARLSYYKNAMQAFLESGAPSQSLWILITWTLAVETLPRGSARAVGWQKACEQLGILGGGIEAHLNGLDRLLDEVESNLENIASSHGLSL